MKVALIDRTKKVTLPNGKIKHVNVFDYNLAFCTDSYVQLTDTSWIKARKLKQSSGERRKAAIDYDNHIFNTKQRNNNWR